MPEWKNARAPAPARTKVRNLIPAQEIARQVRKTNDPRKLRVLGSQAEAIRGFLKKVGESLAKQNEYAEVKIRTERRCGEILPSLIERGGDRKSKSSSSRLTLKSLGLTRNQSYYYQAIAKLPPDQFEEHITAAKESNRELTSISLYRRAKDYHALRELERKPIPNAKSITSPIRFTIVEGDFRNSIDNYRDVDAIITDPPYLKEYVAIYGDLAKFGAKVLKEGGSLLTMVGVYHLPEIMSLMTPHLNYYWTIVYHMPTTSVRIKHRQVWCNWKPILWFVKGKYPRKRRVKDVLVAGKAEKGHHVWQQNENDFERLIEMVSEPGDFIIDPMMGVGSCGTASIKSNRRFLGFEKDKETADRAMKRFQRLGRMIQAPYYFPDEDPADVVDRWEGRGDNTDLVARGSMVN